MNTTKLLCNAIGTYHSDNIVDVFIGRSVPIKICGYHEDTQWDAVLELAKARERTRLIRKATRLMRKAVEDGSKMTTLPFTVDYSAVRYGRSRRAYLLGFYNDLVDTGVAILDPQPNYFWVRADHEFTLTRTRQLFWANFGSVVEQLQVIVDKIRALSSYNGIDY